MLLIGVFTLGTNIFIDFPWQNFVEAGNFTDYPIWSFGLLMFVPKVKTPINSIIKTLIPVRIKITPKNLSDKFKNADYDAMGNQVKSGAERISSSFGDFIMTIFKIFAKFLGVILILTGISVLIMLLIGVFTLGTNINKPNDQIG